MGHHLLQHVYEGKYSSAWPSVESRKDQSPILQFFNSCLGKVCSFLKLKPPPPPPPLRRRLFKQL